MSHDTAPTRAILPPELDGERLDRALAALLGISRGAARRAIAAGGAYLDGRRCKVASRVCHTGARLECHPPSVPAGPPAHPPPRVVWEDGALAVVDKPADMPTGAIRETDRGTLEAWIRRRFGGRPHLPQRLDRRASGLLLVVLDPSLNRAISEALRQRRVTRIYRARIDGEPPREADRLVGQVDGKRASLRYRLLAPGVMEVQLETGRTHQIRRQLAEIGCPLLGDPRYGGPRGPLALRAERLAFDHPRSGQRVDLRVAECGDEPQKTEAV